MQESQQHPTILLMQVAEGNEKAFRELFDIYHKKLFYYIRQITKSDQVAEELVMDVFMKIWQGRAVVLQIENFNAFLFRVAHNKSIDFLRSVSKDPKFQDLLWDQLQSITTDSCSDNAILLQEFEAKIREAIVLLSPQRRKVYALSRQEEMTHDQIAAHLQISKNTVNNHIVQAQHFIRSYLIKSFDIATLAVILSSAYPPS